MNDDVLSRVMQDTNEWAKSVASLTDALIKTGVPVAHARIMALAEVRALYEDRIRREKEWGP